MNALHTQVEGHGRDVVLLHGWGLHSGAWHDAARRLASRYRVHRVDLPGHGGSPDAGEDFDAATEAIARCVPDDAVVVGWSLGGLFAQRLAQSGARRLRGVMLVSSTPCFVQRLDWRCAMASATLEAFARDLEAAPGRTLEQFVRLNAMNGPRSRETVRQLTARLAERPAPTPAALRQGLRWLRDLDLRGDVASMAMPCVVLHGARDAITPVGAGQWLARTWPAARLVQIPDAAHLPFVSHPGRLDEAVEMLHG